MDSLKRASFASKQLPAGPAPLASFEDLPSDELESPEDVDRRRQDDQCQVEKDSNTPNSGSLLCESTPESLTVSSQSTPRIERDFDSHCTLTPTDANKVDPISEFLTESLSSLSKEENSTVKEQKGSADSLSNVENLEIEHNQRKSSWADIFHSHNQNTKVSSECVSNQEMKGKAASKTKSKSEHAKSEQSETKAKDKNKFLSLFKVGKKGNKNKDTLVPINCSNVTSADQLNLHKLSDGSADELDKKEEKENKEPKNVEAQIQNDLDKFNVLEDDLNSLSISSKDSEIKSNLNIAEKEYNILSGQSEVMNEKLINRNENSQKEKGMDENLESSESDITFEAKDPAVQKDLEEDEYEAQTLLGPDCSETEDDLSLELHPIPVFKTPQVPTMSRKHRMEVTTIPIDRPRSTTPINFAPFEAYVRTNSLSTELKGEKIKLILPGEQFQGHLKSPKKNMAKSWADFCEGVLHSPRVQKREGFGSASEDFANFETVQKESDFLWNNDKLSTSDWVTFEAKASSTFIPQDIDFETYKIASSVDEQAVESGENFSKCSCDCHSHGCDNVYINENVKENFQVQGHIKVDVFSDKCQCPCHEKYIHLWSPTDISVDFNPFCDIGSSELATPVSAKNGIA